MHFGSSPSLMQVYDNVRQKWVSWRNYTLKSSRIILDSLVGFGMNDDYMIFFIS